MPGKFDGVQFINPSEMMAAMGRKASDLGRQQSERVSYYRRPPKGPMGGWIIWSDTQPGKRDDMMVRGFTPMFEFGRVWDGNDRDGQNFRLYGPWGPILCHPRGPRQFVVTQLLTYRWYSEAGLRYSCQGELPQDKLPGELFPQLREWIAAGNTIQEYLCPECEAVSYLQALHLGRHLRNSHSWDRQDLAVWGREMGVDFSREFKTRAITMDAMVDGLRQPDEPEPEPVPAVEPIPVLQATVPGRDALDDLLADEPARRGRRS